MSLDIGSDGSDRAVPRCFLTTHWSVIVSAKGGAPNESEKALEALCQAYWWPLYAYVRRRGYAHHDAQDLTQELFSRLLSKDFLNGIDRSKGRFRSFLLAAMEHLIAKEWRRANAQKRGGGRALASIDGAANETQYLQLPANQATPAQLYDQQWVITLQQLALERLKDEYAARGRQAQYEATFHLLTGDRGSQTYADLAPRLEMTEAALKMAVMRMRARWLELLKEEVAKTVNAPEEVEDELRAILAAWK